MYWRGGPAADGRLQRDRLRGRGPRRRDGHQLDQLPAHAPVGARAVGGRARPRGRRRARLRPPPRRDLRAPVGQRPLLGPERPAPAHEGGRGAGSAGRSRPSCATPTRAVTTRRRRPTSASATSPGSKLSTQRTYLQDAFDAGADIVVRCTVERVLVENGRAAGVEGTWTDPETGRTARVTVRAPQVVVAAGSLESPALLLRSQIGGPAVGNYLRIHPCTALFGIYGEDQDAWWGPPQAGLVDEFAAVEDGYGFLIETTQYAPGAGRLGAAVHRRPPAQGDDGEGALRRHLHRPAARPRPRPGRDRRGRPGGPVLRPHRRARRAQHAPRDRRAGAPARGGRRTRDPADGRRHDALARRATTSTTASSAGSACPCGPAASGSSARTRWAPAGWATTRKTSVADPWGQLHDTKGVWIGDGSAFPTSSGTNPMISIMALAHRTAEAIAADRSGTTTRKAEAAVS